MSLRLERVMGIEPTRPAWKAGILPLNYTRIYAIFRLPIYYTTNLSFCQGVFRKFFCNFRFFFERKIKAVFLCRFFQQKAGTAFFNGCDFAPLLTKIGKCAIILYNVKSERSKNVYTETGLLFLSFL